MQQVEDQAMQLRVAPAALGTAVPDDRGHWRWWRTSIPAAAGSCLEAWKD